MDSEIRALQRKQFLELTGAVFDFNMAYSVVEAELRNHISIEINIPEIKVYTGHEVDKYGWKQELYLNDAYMPFLWEETISFIKEKTPAGADTPEQELN